MPILAAEPSWFPVQLFEEPAAPPDSDRVWWVLHTKPRQEKSLARQLYVAEVPFYLPLISQRARVRGRTQTSHVPLLAAVTYFCKRRKTPQRTGWTGAGHQPRRPVAGGQGPGEVVAGPPPAPTAHRFGSAGHAGGSAGAGHERGDHQRSAGRPQGAHPADCQRPSFRGGRRFHPARGVCPAGRFRARAQRVIRGEPARSSRRDKPSGSPVGCQRVVQSFGKARRGFIAKVAAHEMLVFGNAAFEAVLSSRLTCVGFELRPPSALRQGMGTPSRTGGGRV